MNEIVEAMARAVREEIVRQYRDNERTTFMGGSSFYEEEVSPHLIAAAALAVAGPMVLEMAAEKIDARYFGDYSGEDDEVRKCATAIRNLKENLK